MTSPDDSPEQPLTQEDFHWMAAEIHSDKPLSEWTEAEKALTLARRELVRQICVEEYSSHPLYQARAAKDPNYWKTFSMGRINLPPAMEARLQDCYQALLEKTGTATREGLLQAFHQE